MGTGRENGLDQGGGGGGFVFVLNEVFQQKGGGASRQGRGHAGALHVAVTAVVSPRG